MTRFVDQPRYCPVCGSGHVADIVYGPLEPKASKEEIDSGEVIRGGPIVRETGPHWMCRECRTAWCKESNDLFVMDEFGEIVPRSGFSGS